MRTVLKPLDGESCLIAVPELQENEADRRILIVDDDAAVRNVFADYLAECYICTTAATSDEALAHLAIDTYAVVISDMHMAGRNGIGLLREIQIRYPETAMIIVSGTDRPQLIRDAVNIGAFDYLTKPCDRDVLVLSVKHALERRAFQLKQ